MNRSLIFIVCCVGWVSAIYSSSVASKIYPIHDFVLVQDMEATDYLYSEELNEYGHHQLYSDVITISFGVEGHYYEYTLDVMTDLYHPTGRVHIHDDGKISQRRHKIRSYEYEDSHVRVAATILSDGLASILVHSEDGDSFQVDPTRLHREDMNEEDFAAMMDECDMVMVKFNDVSEESYSRGAATNEEDGLQFMTGRHSHRNLLQSFPTAASRWVDCFDPDIADQLIMGIGIGIDAGFYRASIEYDSNDPMALTEYLLVFVNAVYRPNLGISFQITDSIVKTTVDEDAWNQDNEQGCSLDIRDSLTEWTKYGIYNLGGSTAGVWHLMTNCYPPTDAVGIAYVGTICRKTGFNTAVNTYTGTRTWLTMAHELGHNFGSGHSFELGEGQTGGIMDYGDGTLNGVYKFNEEYRRDEICPTINKVLSGRSRFHRRHCFTKCKVEDECDDDNQNNYYYNYGYSWYESSDDGDDVSDEEDIDETTTEETDAQDSDDTPFTATTAAHRRGRGGRRRRRRWRGYGDCRNGRRWGWGRGRGRGRRRWRNQLNCTMPDPDVPVETFSWEILTVFDSCTKACGAEGFENRTVVCIQDSNNETVSDDLCDPDEKPISARPCNRFPCPTLDCICTDFPMAFSECAADGTQFRERDCVVLEICDAFGVPFIEFRACDPNAVSEEFQVFVELDMTLDNVDSIPNLKAQVERFLPYWTDKPDFTFYVTEILEEEEDEALTVVFYGVEPTPVQFEMVPLAEASSTVATEHLADTERLLEIVEEQESFEEIGVGEVIDFGSLAEYRARTAVDDDMSDSSIAGTTAVSVAAGVAVSGAVVFFFMKKRNRRNSLGHQEDTKQLPLVLN